MAIGGVSNSNPTGYTLGGKQLGVQIGQKSGQELFGNTAGKSADSVFQINITATSGITVDETQIAVKGLQDEIDRTLGYRTDLTVAQKQQLSKLQGEISEIESLASARILTTTELGDRAELYLDAYQLLGKEYKDVSNDAFVETVSDALKDLIATKPEGASLKRLEKLERYKEQLNDNLTRQGDNPSETTTERLISASKKISQLTAPRAISSLSPEDIRTHDNLVEEINKYVGIDLELTSKKKLKIERLQGTIAAIQAGGVNTVA